MLLAQSASLDGAMSTGLGIIAKFLFIIAVIVIAHGGWQAGAVTNADLGFETLRRAEAAPERLREQRVLDVAIGVVAARLGLTTGDAEELLARAAERAGTTVVQAALVAQTLLA